MTNSRSSPRYGARALAALFALSLLSLATSGFQEVTRQDNASLVGRGPAFVLICGIPGALAWSMIGTAAIVGWFSLIVHRDAGLLPIVAAFSAPIGFVIGAVVGVRRRNREYR